MATRVAKKKKPTKRKLVKKAAVSAATEPQPAEPKKLWFKVLSNGESCHGGRFKWSLPKNGKPGEWHEIPANQPIRVCENGFHVTDQPVEWWGKEYVAYVVETEGEESEYRKDGAKKSVRKVRLIREATAAELAACQIFTAGEHQAKDGKAWASGSANVTASGSAKVTAYDSANVTAYDSANVTAYDSANVTASGSANVTASGSAKVTAYGSAKVEANKCVTVLKYSVLCVISLLGFAVEIDWTKYGQPAAIRQAGVPASG